MIQIVSALYPAYLTQLHFHLDEMRANIMYYLKDVLTESLVGKMERPIPKTFASNAENLQSGLLGWLLLHFLKQIR